MRVLLLTTSILLTPVMILTGVPLILIGIVFNLVIPSKLTQLHNNFASIHDLIWKLPFNIGLLWYYSLRKVLLVSGKGITIEYPFRTNNLLYWKDILSVELTRQKPIWVINYKNKKSLAIGLDYCPLVVRSAKVNNIQIIANDSQIKRVLNFV